VTAGPRQRGGPSLRKDGVPRPPFRRVLVANRGEIAVRIIRACRDLGMEAVAVYSDADVGALHVTVADQAFRLGPAPAADSYLRADAVIDAARQSGAEAIHPGYGFLSERASFARAVEDAGLVFVGPRSDVIAALGDKLAARRLARDAGVPIVPGTLEPAAIARADEAAAMVEAAREVGFPLLVKAAAGGGGRGMRRVERVEDLPAALAAGSAEAASAFGDGRVYVEREIRPARHVEVQLLGDAAGTVVAVGERDCSLQRRHQKLVEESPAPGLTAKERVALHELAVRLGRAAHLTNAATAEFLLDEGHRPWFLEVNTRLQVEHGVTELAGGFDLVVEQFRIAAGERLSPAALAASQAAANPTRHAIEIRLSAEDPGRGFAAAPGRIGRYSLPTGDGVRVDSGVRPGDRVPPDYDPLVAKLLVVGPDRTAAIERLRDALDSVEITGIQTTLPFHRFVARDASFAAGDVSIDWVAERWNGPAERAAARPAASRAAASAALVAPGPPTQPAVASTWRRAGREGLLEEWPE
jgi:acetyl-CoA carboxylase biotin carboxylase subunit